MRLNVHNTPLFFGAIVNTLFINIYVLCLCFMIGIVSVILSVLKRINLEKLCWTWCEFGVCWKLWNLFLNNLCEPSQKALQFTEVLLFCDYVLKPNHILKLKVFLACAGKTGKRQKMVRRKFLVENSKPPGDIHWRQIHKPLRGGGTVDRIDL